MRLPVGARMRFPRSLRWAAIAVGTLTVTLSTLMVGKSEALSGPCAGAQLPPTFALTASNMPYSTHVPYTNVTLYNPTNISHFTALALVDARNIPSQQVCLATIGAQALLAGSRVSTVPASSPVVSARWYPYQFAFLGNPRLPALRPGWISGLAQAGALAAFGALADRTGDPLWIRAAQETFASYLVPFENGGFVTTDRARTWFQEYPTNPPTYVLNGDLSATIALAGWYQRSGDPRALALFRNGVAGAALALPAHSLPISQGEASAYDGMRGWTKVPIRAATGSSLRLTSAAIVDKNGRTVQTLSLPVGAPPAWRANLVKNSTFAVWSGGVPASWQRGPVTAANAVRPDGTGALRIANTGRGLDTVTQGIAAASLTPGAWYRVSWRGRTILPAGKAGTSGRVRALASCADGWHALGGNSSVRGSSWATYDLLIRMPKSSCRVFVTLGQVDGAAAGTITDYDDVQVAIPQYASGPAPNYPFFAIDDHPGHLRVSYVGAGELQAWVDGRWYRLAGLRSTSIRSVGIDVPERFTGVDIHLGYHEEHVAQLATLYRLSGEQTMLDYARLWIPLAPTMNGLLDRIVAHPLTDPVPSPTPTNTGPPAPGASAPTHHFLLRRGTPDSPAITWIPPLFGDVGQLDR